MNWLLPMLGILVWGIYFSLLYFYIGMPAVAAITDSSITVVIIMLFIWLMLLAINAYPTRVGLTLYALFIGSFFAVAGSYASWLLLKILPIYIKKDYTHWLTE